MLSVADFRSRIEASAPPPIKAVVAELDDAALGKLIAGVDKIKDLFPEAAVGFGVERNVRADLQDGLNALRNRCLQQLDELVEDAPKIHELLKLHRSVDADGVLTAVLTHVNAALAYHVMTTIARYETVAKIMAERALKEGAVEVQLDVVRVPVDDDEPAPDEPAPEAQTQEEKSEPAPTAEEVPAQ